MIWDNGPAHRGEAIRSYLATPDLHLRLVALPAYSPDFNADEAVWDWAREEVTAHECLGTKAQVQEKMNAFFDGLTHRNDEVRHRCRTLLQARADAFDVYTCRAFAIAPKCSSHLGFGLVVTGISVLAHFQRPGHRIKDLSHESTNPLIALVRPLARELLGSSLRV